jgi:hypothetical protein
VFDNNFQIIGFKNFEEDKINLIDELKIRIQEVPITKHNEKYLVPVMQILWPLKSLDDLKITEEVDILVVG